VDAGIPESTTGQREYPDLGPGLRDGSATCRVCVGRGMGSGDDEGHGGEGTGT
jgi:hypothetical protein